MVPACRKIIGTLTDCGQPVPAGARILDLGCGAGGLVHGFREAGYDAFGCDVAFKPGPHARTLEEDGLIRLIEMDPYRLPFPDAHFDVVVSTQVMEHVQDYPATLAELAQVTRPGGVGLHQFPSRYRLIESHVFVPLASSIQARWWLRLWAAAGIRTQSQRGMSASAVADANWCYLRGRTNYLTRGEIERHSRAWFGSHRFCEAELMSYTRLGRFRAAFRAFPVLGYLVGEFHSRALLLRR